jgi:low affinity Fe/Cu permease
MHLKLDEIIRALNKARNELLDLEDLSDEEMKKIEQQFKELRQRAERDDTQPSRHVTPAELR